MPTVAFVALALLVGCSSDSAGRTLPGQQPGGPGAGTAAQSGSMAPGQTSSISATAGSPATMAPTAAPPRPADIPANCRSTSLNPEGCDCFTDPGPGATRACYSAEAATRNVGECHDGIQTCVVGDNEFAATWGPCMDQVIPRECSMDADNRCVGAVGCDDAQCATMLGCKPDAGTPPPPPDAGMPPSQCINVMGQNGFGFNPDGTMWCES